MRLQAIRLYFGAFLKICTWSDFMSFGLEWGRGGRFRRGAGTNRSVFGRIRLVRHCG